MVKENVFRFKQFNIRQSDRVHKVGTDGVLLGAWVNLTSEDSQILDGGTGTGLIALLLAQRSDALITGLEPDPIAFNLASENVALSPFANRVILKPSRLQDYSSSEKYDVVVINPPFFENRLRSPLDHRNVQRHNDVLPFHELLPAAKGLLKNSGRLALILPVEEGQQFIQEALNHKLYTKRITEVKSKPNRPIFRLLMEFHGEESAPQIEALVLEDERGNRSAAYQSLTEAFYL